MLPAEILGHCAVNETSTSKLQSCGARPVAIYHRYSAQRLTEEY
jgi:hypothetical protein